MIVENNNLLNIKYGGNNSSSSSSSSSPSFSSSSRDFTYVYRIFREELNLDLHQPNLAHFVNQKIAPLFTTNVTLDLKQNHQFVNYIDTYFYRNEYFTDRCLFDYNGVLYCHVYDNIDLLNRVYQILN
jgi:hypothetical protein